MRYENSRTNPQSSKKTKSQRGRIARRECTHVDEKREVGSVPPERNLSQFVEDESSRGELQFGREFEIVGVGLGQSHSELEDGVTRSGEGLAFCE